MGYNKSYGVVTQSSILMYEKRKDAMFDDCDKTSRGVVSMILRVVVVLERDDGIEIQYEIALPHVIVLNSLELNISKYLMTMTW